MSKKKVSKGLAQNISPVTESQKQFFDILRIYGQLQSFNSISGATFTVPDKKSCYVFYFSLASETTAVANAPGVFLTLNGIRLAAHFYKINQAGAMRDSASFSYPLKINSGETISLAISDVSSGLKYSQANVLYFIIDTSIVDRLNL